MEKCVFSQLKYFTFFVCVVPPPPPPNRQPYQKVQHWFSPTVRASQLLSQWSDQVSATCTNTHVSFTNYIINIYFGVVGRFKEKNTTCKIVVRQELQRGTGYYPICLYLKCLYVSLFIAFLFVFI